jgi:uncharacterized membrane protein (UPF0182 family)
VNRLFLSITLKPFFWRGKLLPSLNRFFFRLLGGKNINALCQRYPRGETDMNKKFMTIGFGLVAVLLLWSGVSIYPDWLWFENLNFSPVFWTMLLSKFGFGFLIGLFLILIISINLLAAKRLSPGGGSGLGFKAADDYVAQLGLSGSAVNSILIGLILILSFAMASKGSDQWNLLLRYLYQHPFGSTDPIFDRDIGFFVFSLPFYMFVRDGLLVLFVLAGLVTMGWYLKNGAVQIEGEFSQGAAPTFPKITVSPNVRKHLIFLGGIIVLLMGWGYHLKVFGLLYSTQGPAFGASFTDIHVKVLAYRALIIVCVAFALVLFFNAFKFRIKLLWLSGAIWFGIVLVFGSLLPIVVQKFVVKPNELARETPYIAYNIDYTRKAYNLNRIKEVNFTVNDKLSQEDLKRHDVTIQNIRIWDERPLLQTYRQIQTIRLYYDFHNVDVDRYLINNQYRQIMLAARELVVNQLPAQANTWVNRHLIS